MRPRTAGVAGSGAAIPGEIDSAAAGALADFSCRLSQATAAEEHEYEILPEARFQSFDQTKKTGQLLFRACPSIPQRQRVPEMRMLLAKT